MHYTARCEFPQLEQKPEVSYPEFPALVLLQTASRPGRWVVIPWRRACGGGRRFQHCQGVKTFAPVIVGVKAAQYFFLFQKSLLPSPHIVIVHGLGGRQRTVGIPENGGISSFQCS